MTQIFTQQQDKLPKRPVEELKFQSLSEYACAKLLEKYTDWKGFDGITFQVPVGRAIFDFRVQDVFVEYHPISLKKEFITEELSRIIKATKSLSKANKAQLLESIAKELGAQYIKRRSQTLAAHSEFNGMGLICVHSAEEFAELVLKKFATKEIPSSQQISQEFRALQKLGKRQGIY